jgi:hypothetical protein
MNTTKMTRQANTTPMAARFLVVADAFSKGLDSAGRTSGRFPLFHAMKSAHLSRTIVKKKPPVAARAPPARSNPGHRLPIRRDRRSRARRGRSARPRPDAVLRPHPAGLDRRRHLSSGGQDRRGRPLVRRQPDRGVKQCRLCGRRAGRLGAEGRIKHRSTCSAASRTRLQRSSACSRAATRQAAPAHRGIGPEGRVLIADRFTRSGPRRREFA